MDSSIPFLLFFLISLPALLTLFFNRQRKFQIPLPPGPPSLPLIGHMLLANKMTHRGLAYLADRYAGAEGLLHLRLGQLHTITISTPDMAKQALQINDSIFSNRPASIAVTYLTYNRADMAFSNYGPFWRQMRKLCVTKLFSRRRSESWATISREISGLVASIANRHGHPVNVGELIFGLTKKIIFSAAFGSQSHENEEKLISIIQEFSKLFGAFNIGDFFPWMKWLDLNGVNKRLKNARLELDCFIEKIINEHRENPKQPHDESWDMVDEMLGFFEDSEVKEFKSDHVDELKNLKLSGDNIKAIIMDILFGGIETVASAIEWAMAELMKCPEERKKVQEELAEVVGLHRHVQEADLNKLTYLKSVVKESLRLHPPIPIALHETTDDIVIAGRFIPARTRVMINIWAIGRDKSAWKDPEAFCPSRFVDGEDGEAAHLDFKGFFFEYIPFGSGRRSCPGMHLGLYAVELALAELLHCFNWELPGGMNSSELNMDDVFGLTAPRAVRLVAVATPRLSCPLEI